MKPPMSDRNNIHIFLADDDMIYCRLFDQALKHLGVRCHLTVITNGKQLMSNLFNDNSLPDALFLDLNIPDKSGFECLDKIMADEYTSKIPVFLCSPSYDEDIIKILYMKGARSYFRKQNELQHLKLELSKILPTLSKQQFKKD